MVLSLVCTNDISGLPLLSKCRIEIPDLYGVEILTFYTHLLLGLSYHALHIPTMQLAKETYTNEASGQRTIVSPPSKVTDRQITHDIEYALWCSVM